MHRCAREWEPESPPLPRAGARQPSAARHGGAPRCAGARMRVLMTADTVGGVFSYAVTLCRELVRRGVDVVLATMGAPLQPGQRAALAGVAAGSEARAGLHVVESSYRLEWMAEPWPWDEVDRAGAWLLDLEARWQPDVVHLNGYAHGSLPWRAPVLMVAHSCVLSWWRAVKGEDAPPAWDTYRRRVRQGLAGARLVVAPTRAMLHALIRCHGPLSAARVIWNGCDAVGAVAGAASGGAADGAAGAGAPGAADGAVAVMDKQPLVMSAGRFWDQAKNLGALAACSASLPWPVYVAGAMEPPGDAHATASTVFDDPSAAAQGAPVTGPEHARGHVRPLGWLPPADLARWLSRASIYALPARYEPFGLSVLEAALCGCALVLGNIPSLRELWAGAAVFVPPDEPAVLGRAIAGLAARPERRRALAARARARARDFSAGRMVEQYLAAYRMLADAGGCGWARAGVADGGEGGGHGGGARAGARSGVA